MRPNRNFGRTLAATAVMLGVLSAVSPQPASAVIKPGLSIKPGQKIVIKAPSPSVPGKGYFFGNLAPSDCRTSVARLGSSEYCDGYPVTIDATPELILSRNLQLNATLEWKPGTTVQNCQQIGNCGTNEMGVAIYTDPPNQDASPNHFNEASAESGEFFGSPDAPLNIAHSGAGICGKRYVDTPKLPANNVCPIEFVDVGNYTGVNPYTLTIELVDLSGSSPVDGSGDTPFDLSGEAAPPPVASAPAAAPAPFTTFLGSGAAGPELAPISSGAPRVDLPGLGSSAGFDGIGPAALPSSDLAQKIVNRGPKVLGAARPANALVLLLWLVLLPLGGLASFLIYVWRKRREEDSVGATVTT